MSNSPTEREIQENAEVWLNDPRVALKDAAVWATRAENLVYDAMAEMETREKEGRRNSPAGVLTRALLLADTQLNLSRALTAIATANATSAVAREIHEHSEQDRLDAQGNPTSHA
jgi:uncharacterized protein (DUF4213/DUF364 family)